MKVAVYSGTIPSTTFVEHLVNGLGAIGIDVLIFGKKHKKYAPSRSNIKVYSTPSNKIFLLFFILQKCLHLIIKDYKLFLKIPEILQSAKQKPLSSKFLFLGRVLPILLNKPDIFHLQWVKGIEDFYWVEAILKAKLVVSLRGGQVNYAPVAHKSVAEMYRAYFPKINYFHGVSEAIIAEAQKYGLNPKKSAVIRPAVQKSLLSRSFKFGNNPKISILSVGRFHWKKGYSYALDAMHLLTKKNIDFHYTIVAGGEHEEILFQIHSLGLKSKVTIIEGLPHHVVIENMADADLFLLPSVEEGIANVVLESMAVGTLVIATNCGGMEEVIENKVNGYLVPVRDPLAIANAIEEIRHLSPDQIHKLKQNARETILQRHIVDNQIMAFNNLYKSAYVGDA